MTYILPLPSPKGDNEYMISEIINLNRTKKYTMKQLLFAALLILATSCTSKKEETQSPLADKNATKETKELHQLLRQRLTEGIMLGHQDALAYGIGWYGVSGKSDIKEVSGRYPAVFGWELGALERNSPYNLDSVYFSDMKKYAIQVHEMGGINTFSWHADNIVTGGDAWDCKQDSVVRTILPGGSNHAQFLTWLDIAADFFSDLKDKEGKPIPVLFRPFHEHTGSWFWWGAEQCTPEEYIQLWKMTFDYLTETKQINNLIWTYSPASVTSEEKYVERYPGNEYVDMLGFDSYLYSTPEAYMAELDTNLIIVTDLAKRWDKIPTLSETGFETIPVENFFTGILWPTISKYEISYFLLWRNAINRPDHFYAPYPGHSSADDFNKMVADKRLIMIN
jgi:hypothetical protein